TPRSCGLQIGAGYAPKINVAGTGGATGPGTNTAGVCGFNDATAQVNCPTNDYSYQDFWDVGANYLNKFGDVTVAAFGAFMYANFVPGFAATTSANGVLQAGDLVPGFNMVPWKQGVMCRPAGAAGLTSGGSGSAY